MKNTARKTIWEQMQDRILTNKMIKPNIIRFINELETEKENQNKYSCCNNQI